MLEQVIKWQKDRNLDKMPYKHADEITNILEEVCETYGLARRDAEGILYNDLEEQACINFDFKDEVNVDAYFDICVYAIGAMMKLGYDPMKIFDEGLKEINDRTGAYDAEVGKWVKQPKKENAYKANYDKAKL